LLLAWYPRDVLVGPFLLAEVRPPTLFATFAFAFAFAFAPAPILAYTLTFAPNFTLNLAPALALTLALALAPTPILAFSNCYSYPLISIIIIFYK
jgi:hypothetical protein